MSNEQWNMSDDDVQMPLGAGGDPGADSSGGPEKKSKINASFVLLGSVFAAGLLLVFLLGKQGSPREASAEEQSKSAQFQASLDDLAQKTGKGNASNMDTDTLMKIFKSGTVQKPKDAIPGNPFELPRIKPKDPDPVQTVVAPPVEDPIEAQRLLKIAEGLKAMKLQTIMYAKDHSAALIGKEFVQIGSKLGEFTVVTIEPDRVILECNGEKYPLRLSKPGSQE
jgi:hypothetical protein